MVKNGNIQVTNVTNAPVQNTPNNVKTEVKPIQTQTVENVKAEKLNLCDFSSADVKGKLLAGLRALGSELLWTIVQDVTFNVNGNILTLGVNQNNDFDLLERQESKNKIIKALSDFAPFELVVNLSKANKELKEIDDATEKIKQIFGEDIVIIKD